IDDVVLAKIGRGKVESGQVGAGAESAAVAKDRIGEIQGAHRGNDPVGPHEPQRGHAVESEVEGSGRRTAQRGGLTGDERADAAASKGQACGELEVANGGVFVSA